MEIDDIRDRIARALDQPEHRVIPLGNRIHLYVGDEEFEIVIRTMQPKRPDVRRVEHRDETT